MSTIEIHGHRGARTWMPENTISSFKKAMELGADTIELDVVISADKKVIVSHEPWMNELFCSYPNGQPVVAKDAQSLNIYQMKYEEIKMFDCGKRINPNFPQQSAIASYKPLLREVIDTFKDTSLRFNIEFKSEAEWDKKFHPEPSEFTDLVLTLLDDEDILNRCQLQSFDYRILKIIKNELPKQNISLLIENKIDLNKSIDQLGFVPTCIGPEFCLLNTQLVEIIKNLGMRLIPWTLNLANEIEQALSWHVDGIISDSPDLVYKITHTQHS